MSELVNFLFDYAKEKNISQKALSAISGVSEEGLSRIKKRGAKLETVEAIAKALGCKVQVQREPSIPMLEGNLAGWSAPSSRNSIDMLPARLSNASFKDLTELVLLHGPEAVETSLEDIRSEIRASRFSLQKEMLGNIKAAYAARHATAV